MRIAMFDARTYDREAFEAENAGFGHEITHLEPRLTRETASLAAGFPVVCAFVNDRLDAPALGTLADGGVRLVALRSAGYNHVDLAAARSLALPVVRVPEYSPHAVAEHAVLLVLALNRKIHRAFARVREWNFSLEGLVGFDLHEKTVGIVGTGKIGQATARVFRGFGCRVLAYDLRPDAAPLSTAAPCSARSSRARSALPARRLRGGGGGHLLRGSLGSRPPGRRPRLASPRTRRGRNRRCERAFSAPTLCDVRVRRRNFRGFQTRFLIQRSPPE